MADLERCAGEFLGKSGGASSAPPIDVEWLLERIAGVRIDVLPNLKDRLNIAGFVAIEPDRGSLTVYMDERVTNTNLNLYRFTIAEELAHVVLHRKQIDSIQSLSDFEALQRFDAWHIMERNANALQQRY